MAADLTPAFATLTSKAARRILTDAGVPCRIARATCSRCSGVGILRPWGTCFRCGGHRTDPTATVVRFDRAAVTPEQAAQINAAAEAKAASLAQAREARAERKQATRQSKRDAALAAHPALARFAALDDTSHLPAFACDIARKGLEFGSLSERQEAALVKALDVAAEREARRAEEAANAKPHPEGRVEMEGEVLATKWQSNDFGEVQRMLVRHADGWKVWCSVPAGISPEKGDRITMRITLQPSRDGDQTFAIGKRPSNAKLLESPA